MNKVILSPAIKKIRRQAKHAFYFFFPARQVLVVGNGSLFDEGIVNLLDSTAGLDVLHHSYSDHLAMLSEVEKYQPGIVVLISSKALNIELVLHRYLHELTALTSRLVVVNQDDCQVKIYETERATRQLKSSQFTLNTAQDFFLAMQ